MGFCCHRLKQKSIRWENDNADGDNSTNERQDKMEMKLHVFPATHRCRETAKGMVNSMNIEKDEGNELTNFCARLAWQIVLLVRIKLCLPSKIARFVCLFVYSVERTFSFAAINLEKRPPPVRSLALGALTLTEYCAKGTQGN